MDLDILTQDLSKVASESEHYKAKFPAGRIFHAQGFLKLAQSLGGIWDVMVFTSSAPKLQLKLDRLLINRGTFVEGVECRKLLNIHTKLWICKDNRNSARVAFIGSLNYVYPTIEDIMVTVDEKSQVKFLCGYFNHFWNQGK